MIRSEVAVVRTGTANLASVCVGLERAGALPKIVEKRNDVEKAELLVLPGVGTLAAAMATIEKEDLAKPLKERIEQGRATMAICLGMQLLFEESEESKGQKGLAVVKGYVERFDVGMRVPQIGWNRVYPKCCDGLLQPGYAYFANSYCIRFAPVGWSAAFADYGGPFVAAMEKGALLACQFHPELSSDYGSKLIERWLAKALEAGKC